MQVTGGYLKSRKIASPKGENVRPTLSKTRESVFNVLLNLIDFECQNFLDAFAGSGIMGFEAVSRGFTNVDFIERDRRTYSLLKENIKNLGIEDKAIAIAGDTLKVLKKIEKQYSVIYVDPPYMKGLYNDVVKTIIDKNLLKPSGILILEHLSTEEIECGALKILKQKQYSDKIVSFLIFNR